MFRHRLCGRLHHNICGTGLLILASLQLPTPAVEAPAKGEKSATLAASVSNPAPPTHLAIQAAAAPPTPVSNKPNGNLEAVPLLAVGEEQQEGAFRMCGLVASPSFLVALALSVLPILCVI